MKLLNKRLFSFLLAVVMLLGMMPMTVFATESEHTHTYENSICTGCGATVSPYLQQLPEDIIGCTNLYDSLVPVKGYYTATKYDTSNGDVLSVVIPVEPGDQIAASSFGSVSENMGSVNGIRVTYLLGDEIVTSLSPSEVYNGYISDGYITVPDGADAICVPWWKPSDSNWLTLSQISKDFTVHSPKTVSAQAPTCTERGYTAGEICEVCNVSLGEREEIPPTGHTYSGDTCTVCGAVNIEAILGGKYVSILGDSISTFNGYSNDATVNTTIGGNGPRYDAGAADTKPGSYCLLESVDQTWWMHFANRSGMKLLVNNSWAGSQVFGGQTSDGRVIPAAYLDRCVNLHDNTLENNPGNAPINPDVIFVYLGINDYNFNRSDVGTGTVDYAGLVSSNGTYTTPATFGEAYGIMLHKMCNTYPDAQIFAMTLLPENLYSVDKAVWEQHNAYIRAAAEYYDIPVVDLAEECAITWENYSGYMIDKIHPTTAGMELISDCIEAELVSYYKENPPHTHLYESTTTAPTCTEQGYTTYTCTCGGSYVDDYMDAAGHSYENGICIWCADRNICWEVGTIAAANGANNANATRIRTVDYLRLSDFAGVCVNNGYQLTWLAYDAGKNYIGNGTSSLTGYWQPSGHSIATADIQDLYVDAVYFRLALKNVSGGNMTLEDADRSGVTFVPFGQALPEPEYELEYESSLNIGSWQDGAIWNDKLFVLGAAGTGAVYDLENLSRLATFSLDSADVLKPHANSVCFGSTYYSPDDQYPLLYVNVYNNYASAKDRMEGTCCVYRISNTDSGFTTELVQVIRIGFVEDLSLWKSKENNGDVRPYGNFLVDTDANKLYAYVMRDAAKATRFFKFDLPELTDGTYSETYGCNVVTLENTDIEGQFDTEYFNYLQGGTYNSGMILSMEGFNSGGSAEPALRIVDLQTGTVSATYYMANSGLTTEPEVVCIDPATGLLYYAPADGIVRILSIPNVHFHGYTACVTAPTCTEQGYTTYACDCGDSYVDDHVDATGHTYENGICTGCGEKLSFEGKTISILGDSISTYTGVSNDTSANATLKGGAIYYNPGTQGVYRADTWWQQTIDALGMELLVNNSWSGSTVLHTRSGTAGAYVDRCVQLHNTAGDEPDVIVVFLGTNDFSYYQSALGTANIDYAKLITDNGDGTYTYATPKTTCEAYAVMLHKMVNRYPDAEVYCMNLLPRRDPDHDGKDVVPAPTQFNGELAKVISYSGCTVVDLENCGITPAPENFDIYITDQRVHPGPLGMDKMTQALIDTMMGKEDATFAVSQNLVNVTANISGGIVLAGGSINVALTPAAGFDKLTVTVTMGGKDVTASVYSDGKVNIPAVTGNVVITASAAVDGTPHNYYWEISGDNFVNVVKNDLSVNALTKKAGSITDGVIKSAYFQLGKPVVLRHNLPWIVEWRVSGTNWTGMLLSGNVNSSAAGNNYLFKTTQNTGFIGFGESVSGSYHNYGIALASQGVDLAAEHTYRAENRITADGSNMVYLLVDGKDYGPMNHYYIGGNNNQGKQVDWLNGRDFCFFYLGSNGHPLNNCKLDYLSVTECDHTYANGICTGCGEAQPGPVITQQPVNGEAKLSERYMVEVKAEGEGLTFQWYFRNAGSSKWNKSSVKDNTYDDVMTTARAGREVYCVITDANGDSVTTDIVKLICLPSVALEIVTQPVNDEAVLGEDFCVTVEAKGDGLKYQWYFRNAGSDRWYKSSVKDNTYDDMMTKARAGREIYCVITDAYSNSVTTETVKLICIPTELEIISQPTSAEVYFGEMFCATVEAKGDGLKYQWYFRNSGTDKWYKSGVRDNTYDDVMTKARNHREIYCVITDMWGNSVTTDTVKLTSVPSVELKVLSQSYESAVMGERYCVTVEAQGDGLNYQWYFRNAGASRWSKSGVRDNTYDDVMNKTRANREVYCVISDACGNQVTTEVIKLTVEK